jgi:hypothetical protein
MTRRAAAGVIILGLAIGATGLLVLPGGHGRLEYLVEVVDPRPAEESNTPHALRELGAVRAVMLRNPSGSSRPSQVLLLQDLAARLRNADCALGGLPEGNGWQGLSGFEAGLERGRTTLAGHDLTVCGKLQSLAPVFDQSLVMPASDDVRQVLERAGWQGQVHYLFFAESWPERGELLAKLETDSEALPTPEARIVSPAERPLLPRSARIWVACVLIFAGLLVVALQLRGVSRGELVGRFAPDRTKS